MSAIAEQTVIFTLMKNEYLEYIDKLEPTDFEIFYKEMEAMKTTREPDGMINILKVSQATGEKIAFYADQMLNVITCMFPDYYRQIKEKALKTRLSELTNSDVTNKEVRKSIDIILSEIRDIMQVKKERPSFYSEYIDEIERRSLDTSYMPYGIPKIDYVTGGLKRGEFTVLAARPSVGKSAMALQIAEHVSKHAKVMYVSLEMKRTAITERRVLRRTDKIQHSNLKSGKLTDGKNGNSDEWKYLVYTLDTMNEITVIDDVYELPKIKYAIEKHNPDLVIIDYIGILKSGGAFKEKRSELVEITRTLKLMVLEYNIAVLGLAQINRSGQDRIPTMADLKDSGSLEEDADNIILMHRLTGSESIQSYDTGKIENLEKEEKQAILVMLKKQRNGQLKDAIMIYEGKKFKFTEATT